MTLEAAMSKVAAKDLLMAIKTKEKIILMPCPIQEKGFPFNMRLHYLI